MKVTLSNGKPSARGSNGRTTQFKPGNPGRPKGIANCVPVVAKITQPAVDMAVETMMAKLAVGDKDYTLFVLDRFIPKNQRYVTVDFEDLDLGDLEGIKEAGKRLISQLGKSVLSVEETASLQKILENQHGLVFSDMVDFLMKHARKGRNEPDLVGSGNTALTEEDFQKLLRSSMKEKDDDLES